MVGWTPRRCSSWRILHHTPDVDAEHPQLAETLAGLQGRASPQQVVDGGPRPHLVHQDVGRALAGAPGFLQDPADLRPVEVVPWSGNRAGFKRLEEGRRWNGNRDPLD